jgi:prolyl oligopeptidase
MKLSTLLLVVPVLISCSRDKMNYPVTYMGNVTDTIFGTPVPDPYRWLEDDMSAETADWVQAQNKVTFGYLGKIPYREQIKERLTEMWNYEKYRIPFIEGDYTYFSKNDGLQNQYVYYRQKEGEEPELFLDPNTFSEDGTTSLAEIGFSKDGNLIAYAISEGGSDWRKVIVMDANTKEIIGDTLKDIKFTAISWKGNEGFYYSSYDKPEGSELSAQTDHHKLYYHKLGTPQNNDQVVFGSDIKRRYIEGFVTDDDRYLIVTAAVSTTGNELYIKDLTRPDSDFKTIVGNFDNNHALFHNEGSVLYIATNLNAPNTKVITVDAQNPAAQNWKDLIPETEYVLQPSAGSGYLFANYLKDAISYVRQFDLKGQLVREIVLPGPGSAEGFNGKNTDKVIYYSFTNYITPAVMFKMDPATGNMDVYKKPSALFNGENYVSEQVFYNSKDGTRVPMIITYKKNTRLDGNTPAILYGYGGFGVSETPEFSVTTAVWMELGGIYAVPNLRGGGEYGEKWHLAGTRMNKQNVFDDFISAAQFLIDNKYTSSQFLALRGGSNGGLLVGAVMTQRPDLMKVALPAVGVLDMLRYHKFTAGAGWAYDYGTADDNPDMFNYLLRYSPVHNVRERTAYPATFITTADHDDRVVPAHSFKFAARLQSAQAGPDPILIRIETNAGHGAGTPVSKSIEQYADIFSFTLWNMGIKKLD